jgi:redox-sensitive bicupin YhaK (pirin superfamily)
MGLQTISWLLEGEILHKDSLGSEALMHAGQLNLMTSGHGIAHSEETPESNSGRLSGVQLWVALPDEYRETTAMFDHYPSLPEVEFGPLSATLIAGGLFGQSSPAKTFSDMVAADIAFNDDKPTILPLQTDYEHAFFVLQGDVAMEDRHLENDTLHYIGPGHPELRIAGKRNSRLLLIGGRPFGEPILMWWNFVARTPEEIAHAREAWMQHERFGDVTAYHGSRLPAPDLTKFAPANPAS